MISLTADQGRCLETLRSWESNFESINPSLTRQSLFICQSGETNGVVKNFGPQKLVGSSTLLQKTFAAAGTDAKLFTILFLKGGG